MTKITPEVYKKAIIAQYEIEKKKDRTGILATPTPAQLRDYCLLLFDKDLNTNDKNVFKLFFEMEDENNLRKAIVNCNTDKFKPVISFLKADKDPSIQNRIDLAAILVDLNPRPYAKFSLKGELNIRADDRLIEQHEEKVSVMNTETNYEINEKSTKKTVVVIVVIASLFVGYIVKKEFFPEKKCIQWSIDHYEEVVCEGNKIGFANINPTFKKQDELLEFRKIEVDSTTSFFKNNQPLVWYIKQNNKCEYFNGSGLHPITGKPLKPITQHIIDKHILKKND